MSRKKQKGQQTAEAEEITGRKKRKFKLTFGKVFVFLLAVTAIVYMFISVQLFYNFIRIMITDPDAAKQQGIMEEALDEMYTDEEE